MNTPTETVVRVCENCAEYEGGSHPGSNYSVTMYVCEACKKKIGMDRIAKMFPPAFRNTDPKLIPDQEGLKAVMAWKYTPNGLAIFGAPRRGKSRSAYLLCAREIMNGTKVETMDAYKLNRAVCSYGRDDNPFELLDKLSTVSLLLLDDPFKCKLTERVEEQIFLVIEQRMLNLVPTIITANDSADSLKARLSADRGEALIARIGESCDVVVFK